MDVILQLVNAARDVSTFRSAALAVRVHLGTNRDPERNHELLVALMSKGHALISRLDSPNSPQAVEISEQVMLTLAQDPGE